MTNASKNWCRAALRKEGGKKRLCGERQNESCSGIVSVVCLRKRKERGLEIQSEKLGRGGGKIEQAGKGKMEKREEKTRKKNRN